MCDQPNLIWLVGMPLTAIVALVLCWWIER